MDQLNDFQKSTERTLRELLSKFGPSFELYGGTKEYACVVKFGAYSSWIYPDGAQVKGPAIDKRFEIYDFDSLEDLQKAYLEYVADLISNIG